MATTARQNEAFTKAIITLPHYPLDDAIEWIGSNLEPDDVFPERELHTWAESNGYVKASDE